MSASLVLAFMGTLFVSSLVFLFVDYAKEDRLQTLINMVLVFVSLYGILDILGI